MGISPRKYIGFLNKAVTNSYYFGKVEKGRVKKDTVLLESKGGEDLAGNIYYLLKELQKDEFKKFTVYLVATIDQLPKTKDLLCKYGIYRVKLIKTKSMQYYKMLATAEFLVNDTTFPAWFIKRADQVYLNTWHGTPFKAMGRDVENRAYAIGNVQSNFINADFLLYPSEYMKEVMFKAYMLDGIYQGKALMEGYPRNSRFFDKNTEGIRKTLGWENKQVIVYMPTWRGTLTDKNSTIQEEAAACFFDQLDEMLRDDQIFYVKFHIFAQKAMSFDDYKHIRPFPKGYETYEVLNAADVLVTDYSSVFFDYANTKKKVILFTYDGEEYLDSRGLYIPMEEIPFPCVTTVKELSGAINSKKEYDDTKFLQRFCPYDSAESASRIAKHVFLRQTCCKEIRAGQQSFMEEQGVQKKERILVYASNLGRNGITTSLMNLINLADTEKNEYYFTFHQGRMKKTPMRLSNLPSNVKLLPLSGELENWTLTEALAYVLFFKKNKDSKWIYKKVQEMFKREYMKRFGRVPLTQLIQFTGYAPDITMLFLASEAPKAIFAHNDMYEEIKEKGNQHLLTLQHAYAEYDKVAAVSNAVKDVLKKVRKDQSNVTIIENAHFDKGVLEKAERPLMIDAETAMTVKEEELREVLDSSALKMITIGRYSEEKGHKKLISAFERFHKKHPDSKLIIIGGYGNIYSQTVAFAAATDCAKDIILIRAVSNPFPILKKCDLFLLPSDREPLGLVLLEADTLKVPVIATDIPGSGDFVRKHGGCLVKNSEDGLVEGMEDFLAGKVKAMNISFDQYNAAIVDRFEHMLVER